MKLTYPKQYDDDISKALAILKTAGCTEIYLFGSLANETYTDKSDIDLAVKGINKEDFFKIYGKLLSELEHPVDLIDLDYNTDFSKLISKKGLLHRVA